MRRTLKLLPYVGLFLMALAPRTVGLQTFVTADEAKWVYRSAQFWLAVLAGDWSGTVVKLKPAVTTMWTGGLGMWVYNRFQANLPFAEFLQAIPEWHVEPAILEAARWPTILLSCLSIVLIFHLTRSMLGTKIALPGAFLLAWDPLFLAHSRFLHHDALVTLFAVPALLLVIRVTLFPNTRWRNLLASAVLAGLAFLSKSPIFFLGPFVAGLFGVIVWQKWRATRQNDNSTQNLMRFLREKIWPILIQFTVWGTISYLVFALLWPAVWVDPIRVPLDVVFDALAVAEGEEEDDPSAELGVFYYPVYFAFYITPVVFVGLGLWLVYRKRLSPQERYTTQVLAWFSLTFIIFMTLSDKRSARYILPAFLPVTLIATSGWQVWLSQQKFVQTRWGWVVLMGVQLLAIVPYAPYYITYTNPLLGGPFTAPQVIKIGWGEGMDQVGYWLNQQPNAPVLQVGANYASTLTPYFAGNVSNPDSQHLDYIVSYIKQRQSGSPPASILAYYEGAVGAVATFPLAGMDYARIYPGPAVRTITTISGLIAFRPQTDSAPIGQNWEIDLIWDTQNGALLTEADFFLQQGDAHILLPMILRQHITQKDFLHVTRYTVTLPETIPPGEYDLFVNDFLLDQVRVAYNRPPASFTPVSINFGETINLVGFSPNTILTKDMLTVKLAFAPTPKAWTDYTIYLHLITPDGERVAGYDAQPTPPTSQWFKDEVVLVEHMVPLPPDLARNQDYQLRLGLYQSDTGEALGDSYILPLMVNNRILE